MKINFLPPTLLERILIILDPVKGATDEYYGLLNWSLKIIHLNMEKLKK